MIGAKEPREVDTQRGKVVRLKGERVDALLFQRSLQSLYHVRHGDLITLPQLLFLRSQL